MNHLIARWLALSAALTVPAHAIGATDFSYMGERIQALKAATDYPTGTAIAVVREGSIVYQGYFGFADLQARTPVTAETVFYIASATKPLFALNVLLKEQAGTLDTQMPLQRMFPETDFKGIDATEIRLADLLVHRSGLDNEPLVWATAFSGLHDARSRQALVGASRRDEEAERGSFKYSNVCYNIASVWLDRQFGIPWQRQLQRAIFEPLEMEHTSAYISTAQAAGWSFARPYSMASERPRVPLYLTKSDATMQAAGGLVSTASDLARFLIAELPGATMPSLPRTVIERSQRIQVPVTAHYLDFAREGYAWGWYSGRYKGRMLLHHFGSFAGFHAHLSFMPDQRIGLVVLNNEDVLSAQLTSLIADYVYGVLLEQPEIERTSATRFAQLPTEVAERRAALARQRDTIRTRPWMLSRPRQDYVGTYRNALLGDMKVERDGVQGLHIRWGSLASAATGSEQRDYVRVEFSPNSGALLAFEANADGVAALRFAASRFEKVE